MKSFPLAALGAALLMMGAVHAADSYKWTDDNGQVQYTQIPPKDRPYETIKTRVKQAESEAGEGTPVAAGKKAVDPAEAKGELAAAKAEADKLARNCETARQNKELLTTAAKIRMTDKDGNPYHLSDDERKQKLAATEQQIQNYCRK